MRITNRTAYDGTQLRALVAAVAARELEPWQRARIVIRVTQRRGDSWRGRYTSGRAVIRSVSSRTPSVDALGRPWKAPRRLHPNVWLTLPSRDPNVREVAFVIAHEFAHARGMEHPMMRGGQYDRRSGWMDAPAFYERFYGYADAFPLGPKARRAITRTDTRPARIARALKAIGLIETRMRRDTTILKRWRRRLERREAAARRAAPATIAAEPGGAS